MDTTNVKPIAWNAEDFEPGDKFSIPPQTSKVYTVQERNERQGLIEFKATLYSELDEEEWGSFNLTFPAEFPLTARQRVRVIVTKCMLCETLGKHELDTAYFTYNNGICGNH